MSFGTPQGKLSLLGWQRFRKIQKGTASMLPEAYKKFWHEWKEKQPAAVHYIPKEGRYERNPETGIVLPIQNVPIPNSIPPEAEYHMWGGEGIVKGFLKRTPYKRRVPHFWVPVLKRSVVHSEILNQYLSVIITDRVIDLIHESRGFDHYLLMTPACDLRQLLPLKLKKQLLEALQAGCPDWKHDPKRQQEVLAKYKQYADQYTPEEIEWYGLSFDEAIEKLEKEIEAQNVVVPHKVIFRQKLIEQLKEAGIKEAGESDETVTQSWVAKLNPFSKSSKKEW